jgi:AcrR family transcriptional regulator
MSDPSADSTPAAIAKAAGVGVGTLYRHFPTREALAEAVYRNDLAALCRTAPVLLRRHNAAEATRHWLARCVEHSFAKHGMADALNAAVASGADPYSDSRDQLLEAITALLDAGRADHTLRGDIRADDILIALTGIVTATHQYGDPDQADRLVDLLLDALTAHRRT